MRKHLLALILVFYTPFVIGMEVKTFDSLINKLQNNKLEDVETFLEKNKVKFSKDPEYFVILLNYTMYKGEKRNIAILKGEPQQGDIALRSKDTNEVTGFMREVVTYDKALFLNSIKRTRSAIQHFPDRLDIHFGIVSAAERIKQWSILAAHITEMLKVSKQINNRWAWGKINSMTGDPQDFLIQNILPRCATLFRADTPETDIAFKQISSSLVKYYPDLIYGYANLGLLYLAKNEYNKAEEYFQKALKIDPNDRVVLENMEKLKQKRKQGI